MKHIKENWLLYAIITVIIVVVIRDTLNYYSKTQKLQEPAALPEADLTARSWKPPSYIGDLPEGKERELILYGRELIANTAKYLGPRGSVLQITNGMNCQNCHLDAGTKLWGNNYSAVYSTYPKFRDRSGTTESVIKRVTDCFERSLNGRAPDSSSQELQSILAYLKWLGKDVQKGEKPNGVGIREVPYIGRAASPAKGGLVYATKCQSCHGVNGEGVKDAGGIVYVYPPLWGAHSYNNGAGLYRLSRFAGYIKDNMPFNQATHNSPVLSDEDAWDVAAYINSNPRPLKNQDKDWPDISKKPVDHPFGPYADGFSAEQHKYGPFQPIVAARKKAADKRKVANK